MHDNPQHKRAYQRAYSKAKYDDLASTPEGRELLRARARAKYQRRKETQTGQALLQRKATRQPGLRRLRRDWLFQYKLNLSCVRCGFSHPAALDFHHRDPATKLFSIAQGNLKGRPRAMIEAEIAKCDVLCANCHRIEHFDAYYQDAIGRANGATASA